MSLRGNGAKRDNQATEARAFLDGDSFVSLDGREFLSGDDWVARKKELFERDKGKCRVPLCRRPAEHPHHVRHRSRGGDDSIGNLLSLCAPHHRVAHKERNPKWSNK
jgi:hypothetical protein